MHALAAVFPDDGIVVLEAPSSTLALRNQLRLSRPGSYYFGAGGGLGFGLSAAVGVQLAQPDRPVVCVVGEGSVQYAVTAFWSAVAYDAPVTFLVLRNSEYAILKWFSAIEGSRALPGSTCPALDTAAIAAGYGVDTQRVSTAPTSCARRSPRRSPPSARSWSRSGSRRGCGCSSARRVGQMALLEPKVEPLAPEPTAGERRRRARLGRRRDPGAASRRARRPARRRPRALRAPPTSSATPPTRARTGSSRRRW